MGVRSYQPWCDHCTVRLGLPVRLLGAARGAVQQHSDVTGHAGSVRDYATGDVVETLYGSPALPLWE
jgi:hypothetical protein